MNAPDFDRELIRFLGTETREPEPAGLLDDVFAVTRRTGQRRGLVPRLATVIAAWWGRPYGQARTVRLAIAVALTLAAVVAAAILVGSFRLSPPPLLSDGVVPYVVLLEDQRTEIRLVGLDGSVSAIGYPDDSIDCPVFAPDGTKLAFLLEAPNDPSSMDMRALAVATLAAPSERTVLDPDQQLWDPGAPIAWAPDSDAIVALAGPGLGEPLEMTLRRFPLDGGPSVPLIDRGLSPINPAWSPDGEWIAFVGFHEGEHRVDLVRPDGSDLRSVASFSRRYRSEGIAWSPDSQWIAYGADPDGADPDAPGSTATGPDPLDIWIVRGDSGERRNLTRTAGKAERGPAWSPDGQSVAYYTGGVIEVVDVATARRWQLPGRDTKWFGWSATGDSMVVVRGAPGSEEESEIWVVPSNGSSIGRRLASGVAATCGLVGGTMSWQRR